MTALRPLRNTKSNNNNLPSARGHARTRLRINYYNYSPISVLRGLKPRNTTTDASGLHLRASAGCYAPRVQTLRLSA